MVNITGPSSSLKVAEINGNIYSTAAAWEARGFGEAEHIQRFLGLSPFIHLAHGTSLGEAMLVVVVSLPLPA